MQWSESESTSPFDDPRLNAVGLFVETLDRLTAQPGTVRSRHELSDKGVTPSITIPSLDHSRGSTGSDSSASTANTH